MLGRRGVCVRNSGRLPGDSRIGRYVRGVVDNSVYKGCPECVSDSTSIRVPVELRERLRKISQDRHASLTDTLCDALEALRREEYYESLARSEAALRADPAAWASAPTASMCMTRFVTRKSLPCCWPARRCPDPKISVSGGKARLKRQ